MINFFNEVVPIHVWMIYLGHITQWCLGAIAGYYFGQKYSITKKSP